MDIPFHIGDERAKFIKITQDVLLEKIRVITEKKIHPDEWYVRNLLETAENFVISGQSFSVRFCPEKRHNETQTVAVQKVIVTSIESSYYGSGLPDFDVAILSNGDTFVVVMGIPPSIGSIFGTETVHETRNVYIVDDDEIVELIADQ